MVSDFAFLFVAFDVLVTVGQVNGLLTVSFYIDSLARAVKCQFYHTQQSKFHPKNIVMTLALRLK